MQRKSPAESGATRINQCEISKNLEHVLERRYQGANNHPRVRKGTLEPTSLGRARDCMSGIRADHAIERTTNALDGAFESLLVSGGRIYEIFETIVHTISLFFSLLCVNLVTKSL